MMRVIVSPAVLPPEALTELKDWLGITSTVNDDELARLLAVACDICADFTGMLPLACGCEETLMLPAEMPGADLPPGVPPLVAGAGGWPWTATRRDVAGWQMLTSRPVLSVSGVAALAADGTRSALAAGAYVVRIDADGGCGVKLAAPAARQRHVVAFRAGMAASWGGLPGPIRQGIVCLAGTLFQSSAQQGGASPPASVTALWLPWRRVRIA